MERWQNRVAVITGASSGIGEACARLLVEAGLRVVALARRKERMIENRAKLAAEHQNQYFIRECDITNQTAVTDTFAWIEKNLGGTDILVNNAGCIRDGNILEMDMSNINEILDTNLKGLIYCTRAAFTSMKKRNFNGHLVHINSLAGLNLWSLGQGARSLNVYPSSKVAVTALNEVIRHELNTMQLKIKTTSIHPGLVATEIMPAERFEQFGDSVLSSDDVAETVKYVISTPPNVLIRELTVKPVGEWF